MFSTQKGAQKHGPSPASENGKPAEAVALLTIVGERARIEGKFDIADSIQVECEVGGELNVGGRLVIGEKGVVNANVQTVDAIIMGHYEGTMVATGNVEITETGRVSGNITTDSLVISKGGFFNGNVTKMSELTHESRPLPLPVYLSDDKRPVQFGTVR
jgi:cytoskeletal protein CcmA (bactofilin family)